MHQNCPILSQFDFISMIQGEVKKKKILHEYKSLIRQNKGKYIIISLAPLIKTQAVMSKQY